MGDILRRFVARTIAKQIAKKVEAATAPFQYGPLNKGRMRVCCSRLTNSH